MAKRAIISCRDDVSLQLGFYACKNISDDDQETLHSNARLVGAARGDT
jgi:hypothetical protein